MFGFFHESNNFCGGFSAVFSDAPKLWSIQYELNFGKDHFASPFCTFDDEIKRQYRNAVNEIVPITKTD